MKKGLCIFIVTIALVAGRIFSQERKDESYLIRRAYLDTLGIVPTPTEIEWYCVYNNDGYILAVHWLLSQVDLDSNSKAELAGILLSDKYKNNRKAPLSRKKIHEIVMYLAGMNEEITSENLLKAKYRLLEDAMACETEDSNIIDYIANELMCRTTNVAEANELLKCLRLSRTAMSEKEAWLRYSRAHAAYGRRFQ